MAWSTHLLGVAGIPGGRGVEASEEMSECQALVPETW